VKYYRSLRGLNVSFLSALNAAVDRDPFTDASEFLDRYGSLRQDIQKDFDDKKSKPNVVQPSEPTPSLPKPLPSMPKPPASGFPSFMPLSSSNSASGPSAGGGFTPSFPPTQTQNMSPFGSKPSTFNSDSNQKPKPTSAFGPSSSSSELFGSSSSSSPFGNPFKAPSDEKPKDSVTTNLFGSSQSPIVFSGGDTKPSSTPANPFGGSFTFGSSSTKKGGMGSSVGFGFGSGNPPQNFGQTKSGFVEKAKEKSGGGDRDNGEGEGDSSTGDLVGEEETPKMLQSNPHDEEGAGEEEEETVYTVRAKVYKLIKSSESSKWADLGVGMLRLKRHNESGARRVLLRNSGTGKITLVRILLSHNPSTIDHHVFTILVEFQNIPRSISVSLS
jgi:nucleoporin NUP2